MVARAKTRPFRWLLLMLATLAALTMSVRATGQSAGYNTLEWNFRVYLDDAEIGYHNYRLTDEGDLQHLETEADFRVRFLFFTAYKYRHINSEIWKGDCLNKIDSWTNANGKKFQIEGDRVADVFALQTEDSQQKIAGCVKTFAYWNSNILADSVLLNAQTGEMMPIDVEKLSSGPVMAHGKQIAADRYRLVADEIDLELWYAEDDRWLGLESTTQDGRKLRYELN